MERPPLKIVGRRSRATSECLFPNLYRRLGLVIEDNEFNRRAAAYAQAAEKAAKVLARAERLRS